MADDIVKVAVVMFICVVMTMALFLALMVRAHGQTTFRDASGRMTGTATTSSNGTTTFRDASGRMTGTSAPGGNGTTTFRDASGRMTGTASGRK